jgi:hypothetical protein
MIPYPSPLPFSWNAETELAVSFEEQLVRNMLHKGLTRMGTADRTIVIGKDEDNVPGPLPTPFRASGLGGCARLLWYKRFAPQEIPEVPSVPKALAAQQSGKFYEAYMRQLFALAGSPLTGEQFEITLWDGLVRGHIDGVLRLNRHVLIEMKALFHEDVQRLRLYGVALVKPLYYAQVQLYLTGLDLTDAFLVVMDRNETDFLVLHVPLDIPYLRGLWHKVAAINAVNDPLKIPEFHPTSGARLLVRDCFFCPLRATCEEEEGSAVFADAYKVYQQERLPVLPDTATVPF